MNDYISFMALIMMITSTSKDRFALLAVEQVHIIVYKSWPRNPWSHQLETAVFHCENCHQCLTDLTLQVKPSEETNSMLVHKALCYYIYFMQFQAIFTLSA